MSKKTIEKDPFLQTPINKTPIYEFNENKRVLELIGLSRRR